MNLIKHIERQQTFSLKTFGPGHRTDGIINHIKKELKEIEAEPLDLEEWVDVITLALDGAWRAGFAPEEITNMIEGKLIKNENRDWPDWVTAPVGKAIEHIRKEPQPVIQVIEKCQKNWSECGEECKPCTSQNPF